MFFPLLVESFSLGCWFLLFQKCYCVSICNELLRKETAILAKATNYLPARSVVNHQTLCSYACPVPSPNPKVQATYTETKGRHTTPPTQHSTTWKSTVWPPQYSKILLQIRFERKLLQGLDFREIQMF